MSYDKDGDVLVHSDLGRPAVIQRRVERRAGTTPATRLGDGPPALAALVAAAAAVLAQRRLRKLSG